MADDAAATAGSDTTTIDQIVARVIAEVSPAELNHVAPEQRLVADLGYHSLLLIELAFALEDLFAMDISLANPPPIDSVRGVQRYILDRVRAGEAIVPDNAAVTEFFTRP